MRILHVAVHSGWQSKELGGSGDNAGDTALNPIIQKFFKDKHKKITFTNRQVWKLVTEKEVHYWNSHFDFILVGGGGLLLNDQPGLNSELSGWTWQISFDNLCKIKIPFIVYSLGFNKFFKGKDFSQLFWKNLYLIYEKSIFFSLRNTGSINKIKEGFKKQKFEFDEKKIFLQPCLTQIYEKLFNPKKNFSLKKLPKTSYRICINLAFDRLSQRIDYTTGKFHEEIYLTIDKLLKNYPIIEEIVLIKHKKIDELEEIYTKQLIKKHQKKFDIIDISKFNTETIYEIYSKFDFAFGMRGHGVMIPLGAGVLSYSLITHPKLSYLLDDLMIKDKSKVSFNLKEEIDHIILIKNFINFIKARDELIKEFDNGLIYFKDLTFKNMKFILNHLKGN